MCIRDSTNHLADFSDTAGHWALEPIMECKACGLINGYPGNVFKPGQSMSRVEALVLINKGLGWNKETATVSTAGIVFPSDLWDGFRADVTVAANKNLINKADIPNIKFNGAAPRVEVAVWLAKALNLKGTGSNLKFTDVDKIPAASKDMVAGVVEAGIITGLPGNLFDPNKSLTRAEMASIMSRLLKSGKMSPAEGTYVAGQVTAVNATNKSIVVKTSAGSATYILASSYAIYKDGKKMTSLDAIQVGNQVKMILNSAGNVVFLAYDRDSSTTGTTDTDLSLIHI